MRAVASSTASVVASSAMIECLAPLPTPTPPAMLSCVGWMPIDVQLLLERTALQLDLPPQLHHMHFVSFWWHWFLRIHQQWEPFSRGTERARRALS